MYSKIILSGQEGKNNFWANLKHQLEKK